MDNKRVIAMRAGKKIYRDGDKLVKLFDNNYSTADVLNEATNLARVEKTGLNVPKLIEVKRVDDGWAIITEFIEGKTLAELMEQNPDKFNEYLNFFVDLQLEMHSHSAANLNRLTEKMHRKIKETDLDATAKYELSTRLNSFNVHAKLCHGDFDPSNIIVTDKGEAYIIDWAHVTQGNASADAARTYLLFCLAGDTKTAESYLKLFCKKSNTARQYVEKWLSIVAASQLVKRRPEERELLKRWANVVEYE